MITVFPDTSEKAALDVAPRDLSGAKPTLSPASLEAPSASQSSLLDAATPPAVGAVRGQGAFYSVIHERIRAFAWRVAGRFLSDGPKQDARPAIEGGIAADRQAARDLASGNERAKRLAAVSWRGPNARARRAVVKQNHAEVHSILDRRGRA